MCHYKKIVCEYLTGDVATSLWIVNALRQCFLNCCIVHARVYLNFSKVYKRDEVCKGVADFQKVFFCRSILKEQNLLNIGKY